MNRGFGMLGKKWITNGKIEKHIPADQAVPKGFRRGRNGFRAKPLKVWAYTKHPLYGIWCSMKDRCYNKAYKQYADYGGRGIKVAESWRRSFMEFVYDVETGIGPRPGGKVDKRPEYVFDRIDNNDDYKLENVKWSTYSESNYNRRVNRLTYQQRNEIIQLIREGKPCIDIDRMYGITTANQIAEHAGLMGTSKTSAKGKLLGRRRRSRKS